MRLETREETPTPFKPEASTTTEPVAIFELENRTDSKDAFINHESQAYSDCGWYVVVCGDVLSNESMEPSQMSI